MRHAEGSSKSGATAESGDTYAEEGGISGMMAGLGLGALAGLGVLAGVIPVIGPAIAGGTLGIILSNAAAGGAAAGLAGALIGYGIPEDEAKYYHTEFESGRTIVTVNAAGRGDEAMAIMRQYGAYDMTTRGSTAGTTQAAARTTGTATHATASRSTTHAAADTRGAADTIR